MRFLELIEDDHESSKAVITEFNRKVPHEGVDIELGILSGGEVHIEFIERTTADRGEGARVIRDLTRIADRHGVELFLQYDSPFGDKDDQTRGLGKLYKNLGFRVVDRHESFEDEDYWTYYMQRDPRTNEAEIDAYHGSQEETPRFTQKHTGTNSTVLGPYEVTRYGAFFTDNPDFASMYGQVGKYQLNLQKTANLNVRSGDDDLIYAFSQIPDPFSEDRGLWMDVRNVVHGTWPVWHMFEGELGEKFSEFLTSLGYDSARFTEYNEDDNGEEHKSETIVVFDPSKIRRIGSFNVIENLTELATEHPRFSQWFGRSKVVDQQGNPQPQYHGTIHDFDVFHPMSHFGTAAAADERLELLSYPQIFKNWDHSGDSTEFNRSRIIPVFLKIENPLWVEDEGDLAEWEDFAKAALNDGAINQKQHESLQSQEDLINLLKSMGYDGFGYDNAVEDYGSITWVPFDSSQIWPVYMDRPMMEAQTKSGYEIKFQWKLDTTDARGSTGKWTLDLLRAFAGGQEVGYLSIAYIEPKNVFTNIFYYVRKMGNLGAAPDDMPETHWSKWTREEKLRSLSSKPGMPLWNKYVRDEEGNWAEDENGRMIPLGTTLSDERIDELMKETEEYLWDKYGQQYKDFLFFQTKPFVDYIQVHTPWQRQGIGLALYQEAARYYAEQGKRFYASGIQSDQAKAAWEKMRQMGIVGRNKRGYYIIPSRLNKESITESTEYPKVASADYVADLVVRLSGGDIDAPNGGIEEYTEKLLRRDIHTFSRYYLKWMNPQNITTYQRGTNRKKVQKYIDLIRSGSMIPPIVISQPQTPRVRKNAIIDGHHRHEAAIETKLSKIPVYVGYKQDMVPNEENPYYEEPIDIQDYDWIEGQGWIKKT